MSLGGNTYDNSAKAMAGAGGALSQAQGLLSNGYNPSGYTYNPSTYTPTTGNASLAADPNAIYSGIGNYMNPYENDVIANTAADIQRLTQTQLGEIGAKASSMGAFGGSRHGLVEATALSEAQKNIGDVSANLRNSGWTTAAGLSAQDVANSMANNQFNAGQNQNMTLANMGAKNEAGQFNASAKNAAGQFNAGQQLNSAQFGATNDNSRAQLLAQLASSAGALGQQYFDIGQTVSGAQAAQGSQQQNLIQQILNNASGQYQGYVNQPTNILSMLTAAAGGSPLNAATSTTTTTTPGLFDYLSLGLQSYGASKGGAKAA